MEMITMDNFLQQIASKVCSEINGAKSLLDFISLIPSSRCDELIDRLEEVQKSEASETNDRTIHDQLLDLWNLEKARDELRMDHPTSAESFISTKSKGKRKIDEGLVHATISLAVAIKDAPKQVKDVLIEWKRTVTNESSQDLDKVISNLKQYLEQVTEGCEDLGTSVQEEHRLTTNMFKLSEKSNTLEDERAKMQSFLNAKEVKVDEELALMNERRIVLTRNLNNAKDQAEIEVNTLEEQLSHLLSVEEEKHNEVTKVLQSKLADEKRILQQLRESNAVELIQLMSEREKLEKNISDLIKEQELEEKRLEDEIQAMRNKIKVEQHERIELEQLLKLHELNNDVTAQEEARIQSVIDLEHKATSILEHATVQVQKLYRGMRDRAWVKKLKAKSKKGKKQKSKKSKAK